MRRQKIHTSEPVTHYMEDVLTSRQLRRLQKHEKRQLTGEQRLSEDRMVEHERKHFQLFPKNEKQKTLIDAMNSVEQVIVTGSAGTGKTYVIAAWAALQYQKGHIKQIIITRPNVSAGPTLGLFPGTLEEKMEAWVAPVVSVIKEVLGKAVYDCGIKNQNIILQPIETIRGRSFDDSVVIVDESQNINIDQIKAVVTRTGKNTTLIINGDIAQKDIKENSGLQFLLDTISSSKELQERTHHINFTSDDIVRSDIVRAWIKAFEK